MDQFVLDLTSEWKALGLPLNPRLGGCQPASCAFCRCDSYLFMFWSKLNKNLQETSRVCEACIPRVPSCSNRQSLPSRPSGHCRSLVSHHLRSQVLRHNLCSLLVFLLQLYLRDQFNKTFLFSGANKVVAKRPRSLQDLTSLNFLIKVCSLDGLKRICKFILMDSELLNSRVATRIVQN